MNRTLPASLRNSSKRQDLYSRQDDEDDAFFYSRERMVPHLDSLALLTVRNLIGKVIKKEESAILDLMASWDSHIPERLQSCRVTGLGLNETELKHNKNLSDYVVHDLNRNVRLPFPDNTFDAVLNTVSVDYLVRPVEVFREVGRILKPGGLFLVIFSNRMFPEKAVKIWRESSEEERILLVEDYFRESGAFDRIDLHISRGRPRPSDDKYAHHGIPSDPIYAVYAAKPGPEKRASVKSISSMDDVGHESVNLKILEAKKRHIHKNLQCPYCDEKMKKWAVPENPFEATWDNDYFYICFNDNCPYYVRGWDYIYKTTSRIASYRFMYNPEKDSCSPIPVPSPKALRESIIL